MKRFIPLLILFPFLIFGEISNSSKMPGLIKVESINDSIKFLLLDDRIIERTENVNDVLEEGQELEVKLIGFDRGKMKLSMKALIENTE